MKYFALISLIILQMTALRASNVKVIKTDTGYTFLLDNQPYYVKGVGGTVHLPLAAKIGANSIRTWGIDDAQKILDEAHKYGLTVMLGMWLQHERHGFDYDNVNNVKNQFNHFKTVVKQFKDHPALLMWGIGNELDLNYSNTNVWYAVQDLAKYIHETDPNHPTSTVTAGLDSMEVQLIKARCPDIDVYCVNTYGDIGNVPSNIQRYGWQGPYMITEWGPNGHWESPTTNWGVSIEQTSTEKRLIYQQRYQNYILPNRAYCLGSYAFLWGAKQEYTETWYGLFSKDDIT
ncbi:MAG: glycoside hydrolase family 2 TIM barrel-domain containing protein, partial [Bacteroidia bacterium]